MMSRLRRCVSAAVIVAAGAVLAGCGATPFGGELARNAATQPTGAPMAIDATYQPDSAPVKTAALQDSAPAADAPGNVGLTAPGVVPAPADSQSALLSPEEKAKVIAELEAMAKKQGDELNKQRAKSAAACDNLPADELRKKMLEGAC